MNVPQLAISPISSRPRRTLAALLAIAPLLMLGCAARTPLWSHGSSEDDSDAGDQTNDAMGATGRGGTVGTGGVMAAGGRIATGGTIGGGSGGSTATTGPSGGSIILTGGTIIFSNGGFAAGGRTAVTGGATSILGGFLGGGVKATGGIATTGGAAGGVKATGGIAVSGGSKATGGSVVVGTPSIQPDGYVTLATGTVVMSGHVSSYMSGSGSSLSLTYTTNSFCAAGTVAADPTYNSWAGAGFNVNQGQSGASGSSGSLVLNGSTVTVNYLNRGGSTLEFQLYDGSHYWCTYLSATSGPTTFPLSTLNSQCWDGMGSPFTSGTAITAVELIVGGNGFIPTPFDFCFLGLTVQ